MFALFCFVSCSDNKPAEKGFSVAQEAQAINNNTIKAVGQDSLTWQTRPGNVLLTGIAECRLTSIYKVNYHTRTKQPFTGSNSFYSNYSESSTTQGNQWHGNYMPGITAVYGYNLVNISLYNNKTQKKKEFFSSPALVKTLYYPSFTKDTLHFLPVNRAFYMVSVYDQDSNLDGFINEQDLRRFYYFDANAENKKPLVPENYSVLSSEYDSANDFLYVFAQLDANGNGKRDQQEAIHIFWVDLKNPQSTGRQY